MARRYGGVKVPSDARIKTKNSAASIERARDYAETLAEIVRMADRSRAEKISLLEDRLEARADGIRPGEGPGFKRRALVPQKLARDVLNRASTLKPDGMEARAELLEKLAAKDELFKSGALDKDAFISLVVFDKLLSIFSPRRVFSEDGSEEKR